MHFIKNWIPVFLKRFLKKPFFLILLLLLPAGGLILQAALPSFQTAIPVGVCIAASDPQTADGQLTEKIADRLYAHKGLIVFTAYDSVSDLREAVIRDEIQCGYVLPDNLQTLILEDRLQNSVTVYEAPDALLTSVINELVVSTFFQEISFETLIHDTVDSGLFSAMSEDEIRAAIRPVYDTYNNGNYTLQFDYNRTIEADSLEPDRSAYLLSPCMGFVALFIFIAAFAGCVVWYQDRDRGAFGSMPKRRIHFLRFFYGLIPTLLCCFSGCLFLWIMDLSAASWTGFLRLLLYSLLTVLSAWLLSGLIPHMLTFTALIPVLTLGGVICTPMFFSAETWLPVLAYVKYLFPPAWYFAL